MPTTTWYEADTVHLVDEFDVDKTSSMVFYTDCIWTPEKLKAALVLLAKKDPKPLSNPRIVSLTQIDEVPKGNPRRREAFDLDRQLGI